MSEDKQQRVISGEPEVVVATVGRLWSLLEKVEDGDRLVIFIA